jgi:hypothetical protein
MLTKFWESTGAGISERWLRQLLGPAFLFWGGGLLIIVFKIGFYDVWNWIASRDVSTQTAVLLAGLLIVTFSSQLMGKMRFGFLRLLEGYWSWPLSYLIVPFTRIQHRLIERDRERWNGLMDKFEKGNMTPVQKRELSRLEANGHYTPADLDDCMPTNLGNVLQSAESTPRHKYGLDAVICWPRLWLLLSKDVREVLDTARQTLDTLVELWAWGLFFLIWAFWWRWAILISLLWMAIAYLLAVQSARTYADLLESTFDLYRWSLYSSMHWAVPARSGAEEIAVGKQLTEFLWRGTSEAPIPYK